MALLTANTLFFESTVFHVILFVWRLQSGTHHFILTFLFIALISVRTLPISLTLINILHYSCCFINSTEGVTLLWIIILFVTHWRTFLRRSDNRVIRMVKIFVKTSISTLLGLLYIAVEIEFVLFSTGADMCFHGQMFIKRFFFGNFIFARLWFGSLTTWTYMHMYWCSLRCCFRLKFLINYIQLRWRCGFWL